MKRRLVIVLILCLMIFHLTGCSGGVSKEEYDAVVAERDALKQQLEELTGKQIDTEIKPENNDNSSIQFSAKDFDVNSVLSQISVEEYSYDTDFWHYAFLVLKNNSEFNLRITANVDFFDENGLIIGTDDTYTSPGMYLQD